MDVIELTRQLGAALQEDERYKAFAAAKAANDSDKDLQEKIGEFNLVRVSLDQQLSMDKQDDKKVNELNERLRALYSEIMANKMMMDYNDAKSVLDGLLNQINGIIMLCANGQDPATCEPSSCSGSCSECGGCH